MTKQETIGMAAHGKGCLGKSADDEPVFVLVARDVLAPKFVRSWADHVTQLAREAGTLTDALQAKIAEALRVADEMVTWQHRHGGGKLPD